MADDRDIFFEEAGKRIKILREETVVTKEQWTIWSQKSLVKEEQFEEWKMYKKKRLSMDVVGKVLVYQGICKKGRRNTVFYHEQGKNLTIRVINVYAELYGVSAGKLLCNEESDDKRFLKIDEEQVRNKLYERRKEILSAKENDKLIQDISTIKRWLYPKKGDLDKKERDFRIKSIPLRTYYEIAQSLNKSIKELLF